MQNIVTDVSTAVDVINQINEIGMTGHLAVSTIAVVGVISFVVYVTKLLKGIDERIDARIDARIDTRIKPSLDILQETVSVVRKLEQTVTEMNATLSILKEILLKHERGIK